MKMLEQTIIARVTISGSRNPSASGWRYTEYRRGDKGQWVYARCVLRGMYLNKANSALSKKFEAECKAEGLYVCSGRPLAPHTASQQPHLIK
jgi:hypothetical protein